MHQIFRFLQKVLSLSFLSLLFFSFNYDALAQNVRFNEVLHANGPFTSIAQDKYGFMWFTSQLDGFQRYDGSRLITYKHEPSNANSLANDYVECMVIDRDNIFWLGTYGLGLDRFDESKKTFTHYRHDDKNSSSLVNDTITALLADSKGNIWVGSMGGLSLLDKKTGTFINYKTDPDDPESLSDNEVRIIYEDRSGTIWLGLCSPVFKWKG